MELKILYRSKMDVDCLLDGKALPKEAFGTLYFGNKEDVKKIFGNEKPTLVFEKVSDDGRFDETVAGMQWIIDEWYK